MNIKAIVYIFDSICDNHVSKCNEMCTNLVREANDVFSVGMSFGGDSAAYGVKISSLDEKFLQEDVANLAMMCYHEAVVDHSFFVDEVLVRQYFMYCPNVQHLFSTLFSV